MSTANIRIFVLDEADKLLAPEFQEDIKWVNSNNLFGPFNDVDEDQIVIKIYLKKLFTKIQNL